jgi:sarcosine oxidase/L-pipecolate oxidase
MSHWVTGQGSSPRIRGRAETPEADEPTVLIVGAGTFGTSAAYHLAQKYRDPSKVTIIDRDDSPPKPAAAIDINRVIRTDYAKPMYGNLAYEAWHAWFWSMELQPFFHQVGWVMMDDSDQSSLSTAIKKQFNDRGYDPTENVPLDELSKRWDGIMEGTDVSGFKNAYFNPETGWCDAEGATHSFMQAAVKKGVKRVTADVSELILSGDKKSIVGVKTADGTELKAEKVLVAAGAWTSSLLSPLEDMLRISEKNRTENQLRCIGVLQIYYPASNGEVEQFEKSKFPVLIYGQQGEVLPPSQKNKLLKFTHNNSFTNSVKTKSGAKITVPAGPNYEDQINGIPDALKKEAEDGVLKKLLPKFTKGKKPDHWRICYDARTPTEDFLICKYPHGGIQNLYIASGGSSHSYKYACFQPLGVRSTDRLCRFLANAGKYIVNILTDKSNGDEKDAAWGWKDKAWDVREQSPEYPKLGAWTPRRELKDLSSKSKL